MKKLVLVFIITISFSAFHVLAQKNITIVDIGSTKITIPAPGKAFVEVGDDRYTIFRGYIPPSNDLLCAFIDTSDLKKISVDEEQGILMNAYTIIELNKKYINKDYSESNFADIRNEVKKISNEGSKQFNDSTKIESGDQKEVIKGLNLDALQTIGIIYEKNDAFGLLMSFEVNNDNATRKVLCALNFIRVKNRLIYAYIYVDFDNIKNVKWIADFSESWAKAILDANK